jgi:putative endonuclease
MRAKDRLGRRGEDTAIVYLADLGWRVLDRNWRVSDGELDIVASDSGCLVFCEVKTRSSTAYGTPVEAVDAVKAARLNRLARQWAKDHGMVGVRFRIDVIGLVADGSGGFEVDHLRGVS